MEKTRVLVVDDELDTLNLLKILLEVSGFDPITTFNSVEAVALAELEKPDVILLDIMMPKLDGFALCKMMRQHPELKTRPIIFVTAYEALDLEERKNEAGADAIVNKPINMDKLTATIEEVQTARKLARQSAIQKAPPSAITPKAEVQSPAVIESKPAEITPAETKPKAIQVTDEVQLGAKLEIPKPTSSTATASSVQSSNGVTPTPQQNSSSKPSSSQ